MPNIEIEWPSDASFVSSHDKIRRVYMVHRNGVHLRPYGEIVVARTILAKPFELGWIPAKP